MVMKNVTALFAFLFLLSSTITYAAPPLWAGGPGGGGDPVPENPIIVIDPGHGGTDSGSTECAGLPEKEANLDIAFRLETILEAIGYDVRLTRTEDVPKSNNDRY